MANKMTANEGYSHVVFWYILQKRIIIRLLTERLRNLTSVSKPHMVVSLI